MRRENPDWGKPKRDALPMMSPDCGPVVGLPAGGCICPVASRTQVRPSPSPVLENGLATCMRLVDLSVDKSTGCSSLPKHSNSTWRFDRVDHSYIRFETILLQECPLTYSVLCEGKWMCSAPVDHLMAPTITKQP